MDHAQAIRELRTTLALTQKALADRLGVSLRSVAHYESGRPVNAAALQRLTQLAREVGRSDLALVFAAPNSPDEYQQLRTQAAEQKVWTDAVTALLGNNQRELWKPVGRAIVAALERLVQQPQYQSDESMAGVLLEARYKLAEEAERQLRELTTARQAQTGEGYYQAYCAVLLANPQLYEKYLQERAHAARGTVFEKTMASPAGRKS